jgi:hypothetical protein
VPPDHVLSHLNPVWITRILFSVIHFNTILPSFIANPPGTLNVFRVLSCMLCTLNLNKLTVFGDQLFKDFKKAYD